MEEGTYYGTAAFRVRGKYIVRLREDDETLVVKVGFDYRDMLMATEPDTYFITDHYRNYPGVLVRLGRVEAEELGEVIGQAWRLEALKKLAEAYDQELSRLNE